MSEQKSSHTFQIVGSLVAALLIVVATIALVTAKIGPGLDGQEQRDRYEADEERREELQEQLEERREELQEQLEERREG